MNEFVIGSLVVTSDFVSVIFSIRSVLKVMTNVVSRVVSCLS